MKKITGVHALRPGTYTDKNDITTVVTPELSAGLVETFNATGNTFPVTLGHPEQTSPALGWVHHASTDEEGNIFLDIEIHESLAEMIDEGFYKKCSLSYYLSDPPLFRHLAILGGMPNAIPDLEPISLSDGCDFIELSAATDEGEDEDEPEEPTEAEAEAEETPVDEKEEEKPAADSDSETDAASMNEAVLKLFLKTMDEEVKNVDPSPSAENGYLFDPTTSSFNGTAEFDGVRRNFTIQMNEDKTWSIVLTDEVPEGDTTTVELSAAQARIAELERRIAVGEAETFVDGLFADNKLSDGITSREAAIELCVNPTASNVRTLLVNLPPLVDKVELSSPMPPVDSPMSDYQAILALAEKDNSTFTQAARKYEQR